MKRKRRGAPKKAVAKKPVAKKPVAQKPTPAAPVNADEEVFLNFLEQNVEENVVPNEVSNNGPGKLDAARDISSSLSPSSSSGDGGDSFDIAEDSGWSDGPAAGWRVTRSANKRGWPEMNGEMIRATHTPVMLPRGVDSTAKGKRSKVVSPPRFGSTNSKEVPPVKKKRSHDPRYNKAELLACLEVIKKIMKMEAAVSFCSPVDPIALGIPDYFTVIDTPMDFETICSNLQNDVKYLNSDDVYKDVELIWKNCKKYNKKGDYIVYLMKLVQKKFMKYWTEAGLRTEMQRHDGPSHVAPPSVHGMRQSRHEAMSVVDNMVNSYQMKHGRFGSDQPPYQMQHDRFGTEHPQPQVYQPSYANPYKPYQTQPSTSQMPQYSQYHAGVTSSYTGHSNMSGPPYTAYPKEWEREEPSHPFRPMTDGPNHSQKQQPQLSSRYTWQQNPTPSHPQGPQQSEFRTSPENTGMSPEDGNNRERRHMERVSKGPRKGLLSVSDLPEQPLVDAQRQSEVSTPERKKGCRGPTKCLFLANLPEGQRLYVPINKLGQPVGPEALKLVSFVGYLARDCDLAPLTYLSWKKMPKENKEKMWQLVQTKFDIDPICKDWFMKSLASKWRVWKARLKAKHYNPHTTNEERLRDCNKRVSPDQWAFLVAHWNSEEVQILSAKNKAIRAKHTNVHASGSKSFARLREEEEKLREHEKRKEQQTSGASSGEADTLCQVMGNETGMLKCGKKQDRSRHLKEAWEAKRSGNEEVVKVVSKVEAIEQKYSSLEAQMAEMNSNMRALIEKMGGVVPKQARENHPPPEGSQGQSHSSSSSHAVEVEDDDEDKHYAG